jgi:glycerol uptake facilitator-like aquaporin
LSSLLTAIFLLVILGTTDARNDANAALAPLAIGLSLAMIHFASIPATGTSVNPARSIGVGAVRGHRCTSSNCGSSSSRRCSAPP